MKSILRPMIRRLVRNSDFEGLIQTVLDDAIALLGAEYGNVQLPIGDELAIVAQRGLPLDFLKAFWRVKKDDGSACSRALQHRAPVTIPDIDKDADFAAYRKEAEHAGFKAVQSTPMITMNGSLLGIVSTHFATVHQPTPIEIDTLRQYGVVAAEYAFMVLDESFTSLTIKAEQMNTGLHEHILAFGILDREFERDTAASTEKSASPLV